MQISDKDKTRLEGLAPKNLLGQFIILFGALSIMAAFYELISSLYSGSAAPDWSDFLLLLLIGVGLVCVGVWLAKPLRPRQRYWRTAVSGVVSSTCFVLLLVYAVIVARTPKGYIPEWLKYVIFVLIAVGVFAAITCIHSGIMDAINARPDRSKDDTKPVA